MDLSFLTGINPTCIWEVGNASSQSVYFTADWLCPLMLVLNTSEMYQPPLHLQVLSKCPLHSTLLSLSATKVPASTSRGLFTAFTERFILIALLPSPFLTRGLSSAKPSFLNLLSEQFCSNLACPLKYILAKKLPRKKFSTPFFSPLFNTLLIRPRQYSLC